MYGCIVATCNLLVSNGVHLIVACASEVLAVVCRIGSAKEDEVQVPSKGPNKV